MSSALHARLVPSGGFYDDVMSPTSSSSSSSCNFFFEAPRLGPCDLQETVWTKMSSAAAGVNKKRKKSETKPQSQINKCLNEKRRREQENHYIEELAELISASFTEMSSLSVKPDKCAILQETVNQIRTIKNQEHLNNSNAVQQGEVSSSKPTIIAPEVLGPLLLEALEGFLFVVSKDGNVEFVTDNVTNFINYSKEEFLGKSIYNFIHHGDHTRFGNSLMPLHSIGWTPAERAQKNRTFTCRLLVKPPDEQETMEEKQQRVSKYENMQISSTQVPFSGDRGGEGSGGGDESSDLGPCLMCVARRIPHNEKHLQLGAPIEQFTIKLEPSGKIIAVDTSGLSNTYSQYINKDLINWNVIDLLHPADKSKATNYMREMLSGNSTDSVSPIYRLRISHPQDKYVHVQTKAKYFKCSNSTSSEGDFVMATHSIINDNDVVAAEANSPHSCGQSSSGSGSVGGPLMGSVNGNIRSDSGNMTMSTSSFTSFSSNNDVNYDSFIDFPTSTLVGDLGMLASEERLWERAESRHSTPAPSPHPSFVPAQPSPYQPFPFSPLGDQPPPLDETKECSRKDSAENGTSSSEGDSARLRNLLLMNKRPSLDSDEGGGGSQRHKVLKTLLNQEEEDPNKNRPPSHASDPPTPTPKVSSNNNMLLKLLNEKSDDDDLESRAGLKKQNELLSQLLKDEENKSQHSSHVDGQRDDPLLKSLGFSPSPEAVGRPRKRPSEEGEEPPAKRTPLSTLETLPVTSTANSNSNSELWKKNKMLASLLAKQPSSTPVQIPPIPASVISATPQDRLPRIIKQQSWSGGSIQQSGITRSNQQVVDAVTRQRAPQQYQHQQYNNINNNINNINNNWDSQRMVTTTELGDQFLSDILDQVIEIEPDAVASDPVPLMNMLDRLGDPIVSNSSQFPHTMSEKMAINAIQKSLMQCETVVKTPTYTTNTMGQTQQGFPGPPPMYSTRPRFSIQQTQQIIRPGSQQYTIANQQQQQLLLQQRNKLLQAQQQKQRLLQQQQQQQLLIPINASAASADGLQNIDSLINNTVAPNVSLQRSSSVPDPQLSPGGGGPMLNSTSQISPSQRQPYSPLSHQPFSPVNGGINNFQAGSQQQQQQQQTNAQARLSPSGLPTFQQAQLSPRVSQAGQGGGAYTVMSQTSSWPQQQTRLTLQQQQNPMLNAQLTGGAYVNNRTFVNQQQQVQQQQQQQQQQQRPSQPQQLPPVRSLTSPGARQSPFPTDGTQYRLQRTISAPPPQATTQLPGGGVRHNAAYGMKDHSVLSPSYPPHPQHHPPPHQHQMMYPESSQFCFDQSSLQLYGVTTCDRARLPGGAGGSNGMTEYVRQELRAMVGARQQQVRILPGQVSPADFEALGLSFEMANQGGGGGESPKMNWSSINSDMSAVSPQSAIQRTSMEEVSRSSDHNKTSSLLQKLLSE